MDRRQLLRNTVALSVGGTAAILQAATPAQPEGPFHPVNIDNDLRRKDAFSPMARGQQIEIVGTVRRSDNRRPIEGVYVEIWQADSSGKYAHPGDPLPLEPDPDFQFWGRAQTDARGSYSFKTIKPGAYPASSGWTRPPHIHLRYARRGFHDLTTQMYFAGEPLNDRDRLLNQVPREERAQLIVDIQLQDRGLDRGTFDIELDPV